MYGRLWRASTVMEVISVGGTLLIASLLWDKGMISLGTAYLFYNYVDLIYAPLQSFRNHLEACRMLPPGKSVWKPF